MDKKKSSATASTPDRTNTGNRSGNKSRKARAKEEEERRLEEEARLQKEQEEKDRKEKEKREAEDKKIRDIRINELKGRELASFYDLINEFNFKLESYHKDRRAKAKWERYMKCDGSPDPSKAGEINTFLTLWKEDVETTDFKSALKNIDLALRLIDELNFLIEDLIEDENKEKLTENYKQTIKELENITLNKIDEASHQILLGATNKVDPETLNFDFSDGNEELFFCIWANLSHNPRIKDFNFAKKNFSFTLPRPLTLAHFNVRCLFMNFDMFTSRSKTYLCRVKNEKFEFDPIPELKPVEEKKEKEKTELELDDDLPPELKALMAKSNSNIDNEGEGEEKKEEEVKEELKPIVEESKVVDEAKKSMSPDELAILQELSDNFVIDLRNYLPIGPVIHFGLYNIPPQPKKIKQWVLTQKDFTDHLVPFVYPTADPSLPQTSWQEYWSKKQEQEHLSVTNAHEDELGDTVKSKKIDMNLTLKSNDFLESTIGADETIASDANKNFLKSFLTKSNEQLVKSMKNEGPLHINYKLPSNLFFGEAPILARWDEKKQHWRTDEILDFKYNDELKEIHFKTYNFSPYSLLQDRHVHMPFQLWRMAPREKVDNCMFTIETGNFEINIEIKLNQLRVYVPIRKPVEEDISKDKNKPKQSLNKQQQQAPKPEPVQRLDYELNNPNPYFLKVLEPIANKWFSLRDIKRALKSAGLNIFPEPDSEKFVTITNKNKKLEWLLYRNMAMSSSLVSFAYSKWNQEINDDSKIVMLYQKHITDKEPDEEKYKCLIANTDVFYLSESTEESDELDQSCASGTEEHSNFYHLCVDEISKTEKVLVDTRIKQIDPLYYETVLGFLESVRVLTFA